MLVRASATVPIWPPNWSQAFPDFFNALATGLAVAIVVLFIDRRRGKRDARRQAEEDWQRLKPQLRPRFRQGSIDRRKLLPISGHGLRVPGWMPELTEYLTPFPLPRWDDVLPDPAVPALQRLERTSAALQQVLDDYSSTVVSVCLEVLEARVLDRRRAGLQSGAIRLAELVRGPLLEIGDLEPRWTDPESRAEVTELALRLAAVLSNPRLAPHVARIRSLLAHVDVDYAIVRAAVIPGRDTEEC